MASGDIERHSFSPGLDVFLDQLDTFTKVKPQGVTSERGRVGKARGQCQDGKDDDRYENQLAGLVRTVIAVIAVISVISRPRGRPQLPLEEERGVAEQGVRGVEQRGLRSK